VLQGTWQRDEVAYTWPCILWKSVAACFKWRWPKQTEGTCVSWFSKRLIPSLQRRS